MSYRRAEQLPITPPQRSTTSSPYSLPVASSLSSSLLRISLTPSQTTPASPIASLSAVVE